MEEHTTIKKPRPRCPKCGGFVPLWGQTPTLDIFGHPNPDISYNDCGRCGYKGHIVEFEATKTP